VTSLESICVYCGSSSGDNPVYAQAARDVGRLIAGSRRTLVYGGGGVGPMGETARSALAAGGRVIGVIPEHLNTRERAYRDVRAAKLSTVEADGVGAESGRQRHHVEQLAVELRDLHEQASGRRVPVERQEAVEAREPGCLRRDVLRR